MISPTSHVLKTLLLMLLWLLPQVLSSAIPVDLNLNTRHPQPPTVPDPNDPAFQAIIINNVNTFRDYQDAPGLTYCRDLANYAAELANQCNIDTKVSLFPDSIQPVANCYFHSLTLQMVRSSPVAPLLSLVKIIGTASVSQTQPKS